MPAIESLIESAWERRAELSFDGADANLRPAVEEALDGLESGALRVAERGDDGQADGEYQCDPDDDQDCRSGLIGAGQGMPPVQVGKGSGHCGMRFAGPIGRAEDERHHGSFLG